MTQNGVYEYIRDEEKIMLQLKKDYARLVSEGYCVLGCFLYGSQNYDLDHPDSDIDVKAIIIPERSPVFSTDWDVTMFKAQGDHIDIITLKDYIYQLKTGYHNWIELLYTNYYYCPPKYRYSWEKIRCLRERIVRYNDFVCLDTLSKYLNEQIELAKEKDVVSEVRRENKRLAYTYRIKLMVDNYLDRKPYNSNFHLSQDNIDLLKNYKLYTTYNLEERIAIMANFIDKTNEKIRDYKETHQNVVDREIFDILYGIVEEIKNIERI